MMPADGQPWFHAAVQLLGLRSRDRVLVLGGGARETSALARLVGSRGALTVVLDDRTAAEALAAQAPEHVEVLAHRSDGSERFGTFDAMLAAPRFGPLPQPATFAGLARHNLRPGGRCVVDVPAPEMLPEFGGAAADLGWPRAWLQPLRGLADDELAAALRDAGLRDVHNLLATHLVHAAAPLELVDLFADALPIDAERRVELAHALIRRRGSDGGLDALVHRTRAQAQR
ncbi:MAG: hypothetical protein JNL08_09185 [Planctomycetes bacterium]|nr:hypothetical protein [Planctomycetota bacterium]